MSAMNHSNNRGSRESDATGLDAALIAALERKPDVHPPADFFARLNASLPAEPAASRAGRISFARAAAYLAAACLAIALIALVSLNPGATTSPAGMPFVLEMIILTQLMAIGFWLGTRSDG